MPIQDDQNYRHELLVTSESAQQIQKIESEKDRLQAELSEKVEDLEKIIMPLLVNLLKTSDKEYIYWPKRKDTVQDQIDRVLAITRG